MARFAKIGIGAGKRFDAAKLSPEMKTAIEQGMADACGLNSRYSRRNFDTGQVTSVTWFGTRQFLQNNYSTALLLVRSALRQFGSRGDVPVPWYRFRQAAADWVQTIHFCGLHRSLPPVNAFGR